MSFKADAHFLGFLRHRLARQRDIAEETRNRRERLDLREAQHVGGFVEAAPLPVELALLGIGLGLANPAAQAASLAGISRADSGMAAGISSTMRYLGGIVGIALLGRVIDGAASVDAVLAQHDLLLTIFAGVLMATVVCAALLGLRGGTVPA